MEGMTQKQLSDFIKEQVAPMIKEFAGKEIGDLVREAVDNSLKDAAAKHGGAHAHIFSSEEPERRSLNVIGLNAARGLRAIAAAKFGGYPAEKAIDILKSWGNHDLAKAWEEARHKALSAGDPVAGGFLVPTQFSQDVIELLRPAAVVRGLEASTIPMPTGTVKVPRITAGASASYIGENSPITQTEQETGQLSLTFKKLAALVPISNDLIRYSSPQADSIVRDDMIRAMATREDKAFIRDDGTSGTPKGIKNWISATNKLAANGTVSLANVTTDLGRCIRALMAADIPLVISQFPAGAGGGTTMQPITARPGWIFSPRTYMYLTTVQNANGFFVFRDEMMRGTLWGFPYRVTSQVLETMTAAGALTGGNQSEVYFGAFAHAVIGEALGLQVDASQEAAYADSGGTVRAAFSNDQTVVRVIAEHDFALRYDKSFALLQNVTWGV